MDVLHIHPTSKKGDLKQCENYRTIASKILLLTILERIRVKTTETADE